MFRAVAEQVNLKEKFVADPLTPYYENQTNIYTKQYANSFPTTNTVPSGSMNSLLTINPNTRQASPSGTRDLDLQNFAMAINGDKAIKDKANACKTAKLDDLIRDTNPADKLRCGWIYTKGSPGNMPSISQGALGTIDGPSQFASPPNGSWFWSLADAKEEIMTDRCSALTSCTDVNNSEYSGCGWNTTAGQGIPTDSAGNPSYPSNYAINGLGNITSYKNCPSANTSGFTDYRSRVEEGYTSVDTCMPDPKTGKLSRACILQKITAAGCTQDGSLYQQLTSPSAYTPNNYGQGLTNNPAFNTYQYRSSQPINPNILRDGNTTTDAALTTFQQVYANTPGSGAANFAARDLCLSAGAMNQYDFCSDMTDTTRPPFKLECLQNLFLQMGGQPAGSEFPTQTTYNIWNRFQTWGAVKAYIADLKAAMYSPTVESFNGSSTVDLSKVGRPSPDGRIQLYTRDECSRILGGNWYGNGECLKKTGGSYSWDYRPQAPKPAPKPKAKPVPKPKPTPIPPPMLMPKPTPMPIPVHMPKPIPMPPPQPPPPPPPEPTYNSAIKGFLGILTPSAPKITAIPPSRLGNIELMVYSEATNTFIGRKFMNTINWPTTPNITVDGSRPNKYEDSSYIVMANLSPDIEKIKLRNNARFGSKVVLNTDLDLKNLPSHWDLKPTGPNYLVSYAHIKNDIIINVGPQYSRHDKNSWEYIPYKWYNLTQEAAAPIIAWEARSQSLVEYRIPSRFQFIKSSTALMNRSSNFPKIPYAMTLRGNNAFANSAYLNLSANSWKTLTIATTINSVPKIGKYQLLDFGPLKITIRRQTDSSVSAQFDWVDVGMNPIIIQNLPVGPDIPYLFYVSLQTVGGVSYPNQLLAHCASFNNWKNGQADLTLNGGAMTRSTTGVSLYNKTDSSPLGLGVKGNTNPDVSADFSIGWVHLFDYPNADPVRDVKNSWLRLPSIVNG